MRYVGVDLAWGTRSPTGIAVLDESGALLDLGMARTDDELVATLRPHATGPCRVGIDAPIVVPNPSGSRECERLVGRYFGRSGASCHPANRSMPVFATGTRAQRTLDALALDGDPQSEAPRRACEVYPHQACVVLFELPSVLKYKAKPGRDLAGLRSELLRLIVLIEGLASAEVALDVLACPAWHELRARAAGAMTKSALRRCEDPVDAVVCAYVVRLADLRPDAVRVLGDHRKGHVLCVVDSAIAARIDVDLR